MANQTAPQCAPKGTLHDGINISVCEINSKWSVFPDLYHNTFSALLRTCNCIEGLLFFQSCFLALASLSSQREETRMKVEWLMLDYLYLYVYF